MVYKNDVVQEDRSYARQSMPSQLAEDLSLAAKPDDILAVEVFCKEGGSKRAELSVSKNPISISITPSRVSETPSLY